MAGTRPARPVRLAALIVVVGSTLAALATPATANEPIDSGRAGPLGDRFAVSGQFVDEMYRTILGRGADPAGLAFWRSELDAGVSPAVLASQFVTSAEFDGTVAPITRLYDAILGRLPDRDGLRFWLDVRRGGTPLTDVADAFVDSPEFQAIADDDPTVLVERLYDRVLERPADPAGLDFWVDELDSGRRSVGQVVLGFTESTEFIQRTRARTQVVTGYLALLDRAPDDAGLDFWATEIENGLDLSELTGNLLNSEEYLGRRPVGPSLRRTQVASGLTIPWDVVDVGDGHLVVSQRGGGFRLVEPDGTVRPIAADLSDLWVSGETGSMGLATRVGEGGRIEVFSCQGHTSPREIQVISWELDVDAVTMTRLADPLVGGLPIVTGRHGGCQLEFGGDGQLYVGTGDAAQGALPQRLDSLGGKTLRVDASTGAASAGNPFIGVAGADDRIYTSGHRNVQGLARHPETGTIWSVEHGPDTDDEVNRLRAGANAGWNPVPGYNEAVPMTDTGLPNVMTAAWSSGRPTLAVSGGTFLDGSAWGSLEGALAIASLKNQTLRLFFFDADGRFLGDRLLVDDLGRLRAVSVASNGDLLVTTSTGNDSVWRLSPTLD